MRLTPIGLQIRPMLEDDYRDVSRLYRQLTGMAHFKVGNVFDQIFKSFFHVSDREAYVATVHNNVIGFVTIYYLDVMHRCGRVASIQELVVTEEFRGRGVGKALVDFVMRKAEEDHMQGMEIATDLWQGGAKSFYEKCGLKRRSYLVAT